jgi:UDP-2,3-diacylglucosamine pyrophosphatase LpxH
MVVHKTYKFKNDINLYFIGDIHIGTNTCDKRSFEETIKIVKKDKKAKVVFQGDHLDLVTPDDTRRYDPFVADKKLDTAEKQYQYFVKTIRPIKDKILGLLSGNHEYAYAKYHSDEFDENNRDHSERAANELGVPYLNDMASLEIKIRGKKYSIVAAHGQGCGATFAAHANKILNIISIYETTPDIVTMGHVHNLQTIVNPKLDFKLNMKVKYIGLTGTYYQTYIKDNMNYASKSLYKPSVIGCIMFELGRDGIIKDHKLIFG